MIAVDVRWKDGHRWRHGVAHSLEPDGSVRVYVSPTKAARSLRPEILERKERGPRGGSRWVPFVQDASTATRPPDAVASSHR